MNPFDIKTVIFAKHAQHVVLVHFPIALFLIGVAFDLAAVRMKNQALAVAAYYNLLAAAVATVPVLLSGVVAWRWALEGAALKGVLLYHLAAAGTATVVVWIVGWVHFRSARIPEKALPNYRFPIELLGAALIMLTAHLGGFLSGVNVP